MTPFEILSTLSGWILNQSCRGNQDDATVQISFLMKKQNIILHWVKIIIGSFPCFFLYIILVLRFLQMPCYYRHGIIPNMTIWVKHLNFLSQEYGRSSSVWVLLRLASTSPADSAVLLLITYHICSSVPGLLYCHQNYNIITTLQMDTLKQRRTLEHLERTN